MINNLLASCPSEIDLTSTNHLGLIDKIVLELLNKYSDTISLNKFEKELLDSNDNISVFLLIALKIAKSKLYISEIQSPIEITVVFAVYKEHHRIRKVSEHPQGENFLLRKVAQLNWLFDSNPNIKWELVVVDDGCPENSGGIAREIVDQCDLNDKVKILYLDDAINKNKIVVNTLSRTSESQKGGSIIYGMWDSMLRSNSQNHIIVFTDADLSTHLGQTGLLIQPLINTDNMAAIGSRREPDSAVIKKGARNNRGKLFIYLWKRLIPNLDNIIDTQCGFKAFRKEIIKEIIEDMIEKKFAFDIELLLKTELLKKKSIVKVPIAWIDSEAASTTTDIQPYLSMLKSIAKMYRKYFPQNPNSDEFAKFIDSLNEDDFNKLLDNIPLGIVEREPVDFNEYGDISVSNLRDCIR